MIETLDRENLLLLYLADELPDAERRQVEQMLAADSSLAAELANLQSAQEAASDALARLDALSAPVNSEALARRIGRELRQQLARPRLSTADESDAARRRIWPWILPAAAAASILILAAVWVDRHVGLTNDSASPIATNTTHPLPATEPQPATDPAWADPNFALYMDSFDQSGPANGSDLADSRLIDEDVRQPAASVRDDLMGTQDAVSQYLLNSKPTRG